MKTIIITGASGGIGSTIAKALDDKENRLILIYNTNKENVESLKNSLNCKCELYKCDLSNSEEVESIFNQIAKNYSDIYGLINCAGISIIKQIQDMTSEEINKLISVNLTSAITISKILSKPMISNKLGRIINISSMWGVVGASMESVYSATKGGLNSFTLALAKELGPSNITVNAICPGLIDTKMNAGLNKETIEEVVSSTPLSRIGTPEDISSLTSFLISPNASFITGQIITVDGGFSL